MWKRIAAALVGLSVIVPALLFGGVAAVDLVCWIALLVGLHEYATMAFPVRDRLCWACTLLAGSTVFGAVLYAGPAAVTGVLVAVVLGAFLVMMGSARATDGAADRLARLVFGIVYVGLLLVWVPMVRRFDHGLGLLFLLLAATWLGDTGAYFTGRALGRHRMAPLLSPKKTWEGTAGGVIAAVVGAVVVGRIAGLPWGWPVLAALGAAVDVSGVLGDLGESLLKRSFGVKDSGVIMPGHGGILDRIDSLLFSAPVLYVSMLVVHQL